MVRTLTVCSALCLMALACEVESPPDPGSIVITAMTPPAGSAISDTDTVAIEYSFDFQTAQENAVLCLASYCGPLSSTSQGLDTVSASAPPGVVKFTYRGLTFKCGESSGGATTYRQQLWIDLNGDGMDDEGIRSESFTMVVSGSGG